jgi:hypothetical protein
MFADEFDDRGRKSRGFGCVTWQHHSVGAVTGTEGQDRKRRITFDEALTQSHVQSGPAQAPGTGQALLVPGVKDQNVIAASWSGLGRDPLHECRRLPHHCRLSLRFTRPIHERRSMV